MASYHPSTASTNKYKHTCIIIHTFTPSQRAHAHDASPVHGKQRPDAIKLGGKDLEHDECEAELADGGAHVGAFKGALGGADFDKFGGGEDDGGVVVVVAVVGGGGEVGGRHCECSGGSWKLEIGGWKCVVYVRSVVWYGIGSAEVVGLGYKGSGSGLE
ncbi:hypothetical protein IAQ61_008318 [Plenodomus lingam]|uniref:uncharacterized protein n=1 Tax=Leptosphaeria maculans TaxID=5022 RepID=UPI003322A7A2|nr:hypothetical protein IAQ61_008318 [Plenodomus lingam]